MESLKVITTKDGSNTLYSADFDATYHSIHGAVTESKHVFIAAGLNHIAERTKSISILELGFGTGLNAFLTYLSAKSQRLNIQYATFEKFPIDPLLISDLKYPEFLDAASDYHVFNEIHEKNELLFESAEFTFSFSKFLDDIHSIDVHEPSFDVIYFDAFAPNTQNEMWAPALLSLLTSALKPGGVLVTFCAKGQLRRDLQSIGLTVERLPGPPGKREMIRATK